MRSVRGSGRAIRRAGLLTSAVMSALLPAVPARATSDYRAYRVFRQSDFNASTASVATMAGPTDAFIDPTGHVLIADQQNHRVLIWNQIPVGNGVLADRVLGQPDPVSNSPNRGAGPAANTLSCPHGVWSDGKRVAVADRGNDRVLVWRDLWSPSSPVNGAPADLVLGQATMTAGPADNNGCVFDWRPEPTSASILLAPTSVASNGIRLFVADAFNHRVLEWFAFPAVNGAAADLVLGQPSMTSSTAAAPSASSLIHPIGVDTDGARLFVADTSNSRVLVWNRLPGPGDPNGLAADVVLGQPTMTEGQLNAGQGAPSARSFKKPTDVSVSAGWLVVTDKENNRLMIYRSIPSGDFAPADDEVGHGRFTTASFGLDDRKLFDPWGAHLSDRGLIVADTANNRSLLFYAPLRTGSGVAAQATGSLAISVSWNIVAGASGYRIYRDGAWYVDVAGGSSSSFADVQLSPTTYSYRVYPLSDENRIEGGSLGLASATAAVVGSLPGLVVSPHARYATYLAEGDSISAMEDPRAAPPDKVRDVWVGQIAKYLVPDGTQLAAKALGGSTCEGSDPQKNLRARIATEIEMHNPDLVTIAIGLNDLREGYAGTSGARSIAGFRDCLRAVIATVNPGPSRTLMLLTTFYMNNWDGMSPPIDYVNWADNQWGAGSDRKQDAWNKTIRDVALHAGVPLVDAKAAMLQAALDFPTRALLIEDRIHPSQWGHDVIGDAVLAELIKFYGSSTNKNLLPGRPRPEEDATSSPRATFRWKAPNEALRASNKFEVAWSQDDAFLGAASSAYTDLTEATIDLTSPGWWFVRVRAFGQDNVPSPWTLPGRVRFDTPPPPDVTTPSKPGRPVAYPEDGTNRPRWTWTASQDAGGVSRYEICWSRDPGLGCEGTATSATNSFRHPEPLTSGAWYLEVVAIDLAGNPSVPSDPGVWVSLGLL